MIEKIRRTLYGIDEVTILPAVATYTNSPKECNPHYVDGMLPLMASPRDTIVDSENLDVWLDNKIAPILPKSAPLEIRFAKSKKGYWVAWSLSEFIDNFASGVKFSEGDDIKACIDCGFGNSHHLRKHIVNAKYNARAKGYSLKIMVGGVCRPETFEVLSRDGADYIILSNHEDWGVNYPMASLIHDTFLRKRADDLDAKIIADGNPKTNADIIKMLALGANYVVCGDLFEGFVESAALFDCTGALNAFKDKNAEMPPKGVIDNRHDNDPDSFQQKGYRSYSTKLNPDPQSIIDSAWLETNNAFLELAQKHEAADGRKYTHVVNYDVDKVWYGVNEIRKDTRHKSSVYISVDSNLRLHPDVGRWLLDNMCKLHKYLGDGRANAEVRWTIPQWTESFKGDLTNAMSIADTLTITQFTQFCDMAYKSQQRPHDGI